MNGGKQVPIKGMGDDDDSTHPLDVETYWREIFEQTDSADGDEDEEQFSNKVPAEDSCRAGAGTHHQAASEAGSCSCDADIKAKEFKAGICRMTGEVVRHHGAVQETVMHARATSKDQQESAKKAPSDGGRSISADVRHFWEDEFQQRSMYNKAGGFNKFDREELQEEADQLEEKLKHLRTPSAKVSLAPTDGESVTSNPSSVGSVNEAPFREQISQPGAHAQEGFEEAENGLRSSAVREVVASMATDDDVESAASPARVPPGMGGRNSSIASLFLVKAKRVDDAEAIFYAEDVRHDHFRRNLAWGVLLLLFVIVGVVVAVIFIERDEAPRTGDPLCWPSVEEQSVFVRCYCGNSTEGLYDDLTESGQQVYEGQMAFLGSTGLLEFFGINESLSVDSCGAINQVVLNVAAWEGWGVDIGSNNLPEESFLTAGVLMIAYALMDGIHWDQSDLWNVDIRICSWFGVGCLFDEVFHELRLPQNGLVGGIPYHFAAAANLRVLDLSSNEITGTIPSEFGMLSLLNNLALSDLHLTGTIPTELFTLDRLGVLKLGQNYLTGTVPAELFHMTSLRQLNLDRNLFHGSLPAGNDMSALQLSILRLDNNELTGEIPSELATLSKLEVLMLGNNTFTGTIPDFLGDIPSLQFLDVHNSGLTGKVPETFCADGRVTSRITKACGTSEEDCSCCTRDISHFAKVYIRCAEDVPDLG